MNIHPKLGAAIAALSLAMIFQSGHVGAASTQKQPPRDTLTVQVTKSSGKVRGAVTVTFGAGKKKHTVGKCASATCTMYPLQGKVLTLTQSANSKAAPFADWEVTNNGPKTTVSGKQLSLYISNGKATVKAVYVVSR